MEFHSEFEYESLFLANFLICCKEASTLQNETILEYVAQFDNGLILYRIEYVQF